MTNLWLLLLYQENIRQTDLFPQSWRHKHKRHIWDLFSHSAKSCCKNCAIQTWEVCSVSSCSSSPANIFDTPWSCRLASWAFANLRWSTTRIRLRTWWSSEECLVLRCDRETGINKLYVYVLFMFNQKFSCRVFSREFKAEFKNKQGRGISRERLGDIDKDRDLCFSVLTFF